MEKNKTWVFLFATIIFLCSCANLRGADGQTKTSVRGKIDKLHIGNLKSDVKNLIGAPGEERNIGGDHTWLYYRPDKDGFQEAAVSFSGNGTVTSITVVPKLGDPEADIENVKNTRLLADDYIIEPRKRCQRDYVPSISYYLSLKNGYIIEFDRTHSQVLTYSYCSPEYVSEFLNKIRDCRF